MKGKRTPYNIQLKLTAHCNDEIRELELQKNEDLYQEYIHMLENIVGDGAATVSVDLEFSDKNFGNGVSVRIFCSLTCNQSLQDVEMAYQYASQIAQDNLERSIPEVKRIYEQFANNEN